MVYRIISIDTSAAWKIAGVECVVTADDVPGQLTYGLISSDQPVFAKDVVRYMGEPVAAVAADHPET
jgi:xanthine dehydrogenase molybdopterin-binding subunit B